MQRRGSVPLRANSTSSGSGALEAGLPPATSSKGHPQAKARTLGSHGQVPTRVAQLEPSRTQEVRSERAWRRYDPGGHRRRSLLGLPLLSPLSKWVAHWDAVASGVDLTYTAFLVPLSVGFGSQASIDWLVGLDFAATAIFSADLMVGLHTGFILQSWTGRRMVVLDGPTCLHQYVRHGSFLRDAAAVLAIVPQVAVLALGGGNVAWKLFHFLRMLRLFRVKRLATSAWGAALACGPGGSRFMFEMTTAGMYGLCVAWMLALLTNLLGCFWWWLAEVQGVENSWVEGPYVPTQLHLGDLAVASAPVRWLYSCYFALSTITTAVYGDVICTTVPEIAVVMLYDCFSVFWWACVVTLIFEVIEASSHDAHKASALLDQLFEAEAWMQERLLPGDLQQRVRRFYAEVWSPAEAGNEAEQLRELPAALRADVVWRLAGPVLHASRLLRPLPEEALRFLSADLWPCHTPAGLDIFKQGDKAQGRCYVLQAGEVAILRGWRLVTTVRAPAMLGQAALLEPHGMDCPEVTTRLHTARAVSSCSVWCLEASHVAALLQDDPALMHAVVDAYLQYLEGLTMPKAAHQLEQAGPPPSSSSAQAAPAFAAHLASLRRALQGLLLRGATATAAPADMHARRLAPAGPASPQGGEARWLEVQQVEAAAASAMQEQEADSSTNSLVVAT